VFEVAKGSGTITTLASFNGTDGAYPYAALVLDGSGNLYGTTGEGGPTWNPGARVFGDGTVFEVASGSGAITTLASFSGANGAGGAGLLLDGSGNLYGETSGGGTAADGTLFELAEGSGTITTLASFNGTNGQYPQGGLLLDSSGDLFGTALEGGVSGYGTVFALTKGSRTITTLASFDYTHGEWPQAGLILDSGGNLYGTTELGGAGGAGTVFEVAAASGTVTTLASFNGADGIYPEAGLIVDASGNLYGTTEGGGADGTGTIFDVAHGSSTITTLASFGYADGANPQSGLVMGSSGNLYGTTAGGGPSGAGTVFEIAAGSHAITPLASFDGAGGAAPSGNLVMDGSGNLYGTTSYGGASNDGTLFELAAGSGTIATIASFNGTDGMHPYGGLIMDGSGNLYGTTYGTPPGRRVLNDGTVFEVAKGSATITTLASFDGTDGANPDGALILDSGGNLYGTTVLGGPTWNPTKHVYGDGTVFEVAKGSGTVTTLASFSGTNGQGPTGGVVMDGSGNLYGTTSQGGDAGYGTVFEMSAGNGTLTTLASFDNANGGGPSGSLIMDRSGNLYGTTYGGGAAGAGTVFELARASGTLATLASFDSTDGQGPEAGVVTDSSGNFYGTTTYGGASNLGTVFELPATAVLDQWTGASFAVDTNWSDGANWSTGASPAPGQPVLFTTNASVKDFTSTVDAGFTNVIGDLDIDSTWGGTITVNTALAVGGNFILGSGTFGSSGAVTISGSASQWTAGQIVVGSGGFTNNGTLTADATGGNLVLTGAGTLSNTGTITEAGTNSLVLENGATLSNGAGATFDLTNNASISQSGGGTFTSAGTLEKTGGTGTSTITSAFSNSAQITVQTGTLALASAGGTSTGGTFNVSQGATLNLTGGSTVSYAGTYTGTGQGTVALNGGTLAVGTGGATFDMAGNLFQWTGGTIDVTSGTFTNAGTINDAGGGNVVLTGAGTLINQQQFLETSTGNVVLTKGTTLENAQGAIYLIESNGGITESGGGALVNAGTLVKSKGTGTSTIASSTLSNTGAVDVTHGTLDITATVAQVSGKNLTAGTWVVVGSSKVHSKLDITSATGFTTIGSKAGVTLSGLNTTFTNLTGLTTIAQGGSFSLLGGQSFTTAGALTDKGLLTLSPGSVLTVSGSFTQTATGKLTIELGGTNAAPTFGQLVSTTGTVTLAGSLTVTSTVVPTVGSSFELLDNGGDAAIGGAFAGLPEGTTFTVTAGTTTMTFQISYTGSDADGSQNIIITRIS
jgi:uncharacterized repeat protein (TIGR03803 family)